METEAGGSPRNHVITFDWTDAESVTAAIIDAVAAASNSSPTELEPLFDTVDPDALDQIFETAPRSVLAGPIVEFPYQGMVIQISATGEGRILTQR